MSDKFIKVIVIDPYATEVREQWIRRGSLTDISNAIGYGCNMFECGYPDNIVTGDALYFDEEGLFGGQSTGFSIGEFQLIMGWAMMKTATAQRPCHRRRSLRMLSSG